MIRFLELAETGSAALWEVLRDSVWQPTEERLRWQAEACRNDPALRAFALEEDGRLAAALILDVRDPSSPTIRNIGVIPARRGHGLGRRLIEGAAARYAPCILSAETDGDAVGFYRACGFEIEALGDRYGSGTSRYACRLQTGTPPGGDD